MGQRRFDFRKVLRLSAVAPLGVLLGVLAFQGITRAGLLTTTSAYRLDEAALARAEKPGPGLRVLFIGNSLTYFNDMPAMVAKLVEAGPTPERPLLAVSYTPPGQELAQDVHDKDVERLLHAVHLDVVVMQERLTRGNALLAMDLQGSLIPVGRAFAAAVTARPRTPRWNDDTAHPSLEGSYLAASVMYDALFAPRDPATSTYAGGLPAGEARFLRVIAHAIWLDHPTPSVYADWQRP